ncbi:MAG: hypothetical protein JSW44_01955 [Candidatus Bathyarchaeota archaeon]|nr:MAG: hypothetical protein JSW44_01955 [Candidatus Bathyarchaeota archaeon]
MLSLGRKFDFGREILKVIAIITMTIDHIYAILYPDLTFLNIIGRLAFPLFAYLIVLGIESTKKPRKYMITLLSFALISQIPYFLAFEIQPFERLNILFSLFLSAVTIYFYNKRSLLALIPVLLSILLMTEGSYYVVLTAVGMKILKGNPKLGFLVLFALNLQFLLIPNTQIMSLFAVPLILLHAKNWLKMEILIPEDSFYYSLRKYVFYIFYPLHLALLYSIKLFFF